MGIQQLLLQKKFITYSLAAQRMLTSREEGAFFLGLRSHTGVYFRASRIHRVPFQGQHILGGRFQGPRMQGFNFRNHTCRGLHIAYRGSLPGVGHANSGSLPTQNHRVVKGGVTIPELPIGKKKNNLMSIIFFKNTNI